MAGALYERSLPILIAAVAATQVVALVLLIATLRRHQTHELADVYAPASWIAFPSRKPTLPPPRRALPVAYVRTVPTSSESVAVPVMSTTRRGHVTRHSGVHGVPVVYLNGQFATQRSCTPSRRPVTCRLNRTGGGTSPTTSGPAATSRRSIGNSLRQGLRPGCVVRCRSRRPGSSCRPSFRRRWVLAEPGSCASYRTVSGAAHSPAGMAGPCPGVRGRRCCWVRRRWCCTT